MSESYTRGDCGEVVYPNGFEWPCEALGCAFEAREWHGGQWTGLYALGCGDFSPETVVRAASEAADCDGFEGADDLAAWADGVRDLVSE